MNRWKNSRKIKEVLKDALRIVSILQVPVRPISHWRQCSFEPDTWWAGHRGIRRTREIKKVDKKKVGNSGHQEFLRTHKF